MSSIDDVANTLHPRCINPPERVQDLDKRSPFHVRYPADSDRGVLEWADLDTKSAAVRAPMPGSKASTRFALFTLARPRKHVPHAYGVLCGISLLFFWHPSPRADRRRQYSLGHCPGPMSQGSGEQSQALPVEWVLNCRDDQRPKWLTASWPQSWTSVGRLAGSSEPGWHLALVG